MDLITNNLLQPGNSASPSQASDSIKKIGELAHAQSKQNPIQSNTYDDAKTINEGIDLPVNGKSLPNDNAKDSKFKLFLTENINDVSSPLGLNSDEEIKNIELTSIDEQDNERLTALILNQQYLADNESQRIQQPQNLLLNTIQTEIDKQSVLNHQVFLNPSHEEGNDTTQLNLQRLQNTEMPAALIAHQLKQLKVNGESNFEQVINPETEREADNLDKLNLVAQNERLLEQDDKQYDIAKILEAAKESEIKSLSKKEKGLTSEANNEIEIVAPKPAMDVYAKLNDLNFKTEFSIKENASINNPKMMSMDSFNDEMSNQIQLMMNTNENSARIHINPPDLGEIEIKIHQHEDKTHISFVTNVEQTKEMINLNLDQLKINLEQSGLFMGDVWVGTQTEGETQKHQAAKNEYQDSNSVKPLSFEMTKRTSSVRTLDLYA